ncbi:FCD domain-containing protein [Microbacterium sp. H1-D42]|uniref:FadR/GntR family transcriptional regulator n=1 Tax=Microbacterium sp. H1-D42 TaxID=2925844 RepID=UPI001F53695E|nr:FCD domain-containing protein [Microbacterium sp. H1-D42]UNK70495.1 FCD domain-containing protein [Microbacterium sp. H1-D42]
MAKTAVDRTPAESRDADADPLWNRPDRPKRPRRLSTAVSEELVRRIVAGEYPVGTLLPPEPQLVAEFEVSRPVAREAVKYLEAAGLVTIRQGDGTAVRARPWWNLTDPTVLRIALALNVDERMRGDAVALRLHLELSLLEEAAPLMTDEDLREMQASVERMDTATSLEDLTAADLAFHQVYQSRAGNLLTGGIVHLLVAEMPPPGRVFADPRASYDKANVQHRAIYDALREGRFDDAKTALRAHVTEMWM